jgi:hypothetical protein
MSAATVLQEKNGEGAGQWSATRLITVSMAFCYDLGLVLSAWRGHFHDLGVPVCALGAALNLAVPIQGWLMSTSGQALMSKMLDAVREKIDGLGNHPEERHP